MTILLTFEIIADLPVESTLETYLIAIVLLEKE